ncbi:MAG: ornithine--oxo-acid transaminase [Candidatus Thermoplasmatota archaeon]|nr:ornithine--oxo-acid transaminase [Candidatus Thermoplasmatota archaeon]MBU1915374.1 ornithine--oxo-acid transaminase [Candidatus Thermoplasmatota archaeon]
MKATDYIELEQTYGAHNYHPLPVVISKAKGVWVWDVEGKKYIDMLSSYSAINQGHLNDRIVKAAIDQMKKVSLTSRAFSNDRMGPFLKKLCEVSGMEMALPMNTGAEAVETSIKLARRYAHQKKGIPESEGEIIVCENNFHGRTTTIISFSSDPDSKKGFGPFTPGFVTIPYDDIPAFKKAINPKTIGILVEPIQGEAGINIPSPGYLKELRKICSEKGILLMIDEIQTGFARTGRMFAFEHEGIKPDVLMVGKALGGGLYPVSACLSSREIMSVFTPGSHGSTFGGNPLAAAIAEESLNVLVDEKLADRSIEMGAYFVKRLKEIKSKKIKAIRAKGLLIGVEFYLGQKETVRPLCEKLMEKGVLAKDTHEKTIRFTPPLVITKDEIDWAMERIKEVFESA